MVTLHESQSVFDPAGLKRHELPGKPRQCLRSGLFPSIKTFSFNVNAQRRRRAVRYR
jgi:hypothetical protein